MASVKAAILTANPNVQIIDISHQINPFDIGHAAYVLSHSYRNFPEGTIHLIAMDPSDKANSISYAARLNGHYFVGRDTGILSLISGKEPDELVQLPENSSTFAAKDLYAPVCAKIAQGISLEQIGKPTSGLKKLFNRSPKLTKREIVGNIIRVDKYGNLITNIQKKDFDKIQELNGQVPFRIQFGREQYSSFHKDYSDVDPGDCYLLFNSDERLQIGINKGNASELLGLRLDAPVYIEFKI